MAEFQLRPAEHQLDQVKANRHKHMFDSDGGHIVITNQRLYFHAHAFNFDGSPFEIPLETIAEIKTFSALGFVPNGLKILTKQGQTHQFVVNRRGQILALIASLIQAQ